MQSREAPEPDSEEVCDRINAVLLTVAVAGQILPTENVVYVNNGLSLLMLNE